MLSVYFGDLVDAELAFTTLRQSATAPSGNHQGYIALLVSVAFNLELPSNTTMSRTRLNRHHLLPVVPLVILYLATQPLSYTTGDGSAELAAALTQVPLFRSHHLLVTPLYSGLVWLHNLAGLPFGEFITLQVFNVLCMAASLITLSLTLELFRISWPSRYCTVLIAGLCHGLWLHSITPETGIQAHLLLTLSLYFQVQRASSSTGRLQFLFLSAICFAGSVMFAFNYIILAPLVMLYSSSFAVRDLKHCLSVTLVFGATAAACGASAFLLAALYEGISTPEAFFAWLLTHGEHQRLTHVSAVSALSVLRALSGFFALFFWPENVLTQLKLLLRHASNGTDLPITWLILTSSTLIYLLTLVLRGMLIKTQSNQALGVIGGFIILFLFGVKWLGSDPQFWIPWAPLAFIPMGIGISTIKRFEYILLAWVPIAMLCSNLSIESPSLLFPNGGSKFAEAQCVANVIHTEISAEPHAPLVYSPGGIETEFLQALLPNASVKSLVYDPILSRENDLWAYLVPRIRQELNSGRTVIFDGLQVEEDLQRVGMWEMFESLHKLNRDEMRNMLQTHFSPIQRTICSGTNLLVLPPTPQKQLIVSPTDRANNH